MHEFLDHYFTFYYVTLSLFALAGLLFILKNLFSSKPSKDTPTQITFKKLNQRFDKELQKLESLVGSKPSFFKRLKQKFQKSEKTESPENSEPKAKEEETEEPQGTVYVLDFVGDIMANATEHLREEISLVLQKATPQDEIVIRLTSPGGSVSQYGLASSQLARIREANIPLTVCVDVVAASGGYMMASVANQIVAAPFAFIGSIGVVAGIPNIHKVLQKNDVDYHLFTAGQYKRTVTPLTEVTEEGRHKFQETLTEIHDAFKGHITQYRSSVAIDEVATGEHWLATQALEKGLVDKIETSDDYLHGKMSDFHVVEIKTEETRNKLSRFLEKNMASVLSRYQGLKALEHPSSPVDKAYFL